MKRFVIILMTVAMIFCSCTCKYPLPSDDTVETETPETEAAYGISDICEEKVFAVLAYGGNFRDKLEYSLNEEEIAELCGIVSKIKVTGPADEHEPIDGRSSRDFKIILKNGDSFDFTGSYPYVTINGVDYDVDDKTPLDELHAFYKNLLFGDEAQ